VAKCEKNHIWPTIFRVFADMTTAPHGRRQNTAEDAVMKARFKGRWAAASRANLALALTLFTTGSALADIATPAQKKACTPDVYRLCGVLAPNVGWAVTDYTIDHGTRQCMQGGFPVMSGSH
jgi:hypothetical protein